VLFLRKAGHPLSREELVGEVWPDVFVTDESLSRCISDIRQALSDDKQQLIKTLPRRGYVFTAPVRTSGASDDPIDGTASGRVPVLTRVSAMMLVLVSCVLFGIGVVAHTTWLGDHEPDRHAGASVAVLPFANAGGAQGQDYFAEGLAEDITIRLSKFADLLVIAPESAAKFRGGINNLPDVARQLRCRYLVLGTVRENGPKLRISARLVDIASGRQEWAEIYEGAPAQVGGVQGELAERIATMLSSKITQAELERARQKPPASLGAYDLFLRGRAALSRAETSAPALYGDELIRARDWLEQAVSLDENYGPALAALSDAYHRAWLVAIDTPCCAAISKTAKSAIVRLTWPSGQWQPIRRWRARMRSWLGYFTGDIDVTMPSSNSDARWSSIQI
jgi:TolB-like protein